MEMDTNVYPRFCESIINCWGPFFCGVHCVIFRIIFTYTYVHRNCCIWLIFCCYYWRFCLDFVALIRSPRKIGMMWRHRLCSTSVRSARLWWPGQLEQVRSHTGWKPTNIRSFLLHVSNWHDRNKFSKEQCYEAMYKGNCFNNIYQQIKITVV